jgi:hypothetical protein
MTTVKQLLQFLGRDRAEVKYVFARVRLLSTREVVAQLTPFWCEKEANAYLNKVNINDAVIRKAFRGNEGDLRSAIKLSGLMFFRHFPLVGLLMDTEKIQDLLRLDSVAGVYEVPDAYGMDYIRTIEGLHWALEHKDADRIKIVNISMAPPAPFEFDANEAMNVATRVLAEHGIVVVLAAGNEGERGPGRLSRWARAPWVISVGATDKNGKALWKGSSIGLPGGSGPTVVAVGEDVAGWTPPGVADVGAGAMAFGTGTSFAAPKVTGILARAAEFIQTMTQDAQTSQWCDLLRQEMGCDVRPLTLSIDVAQRMLADMAIPLEGYGPHQQGAGLVTKEISDSYFQKFRLSNFIQVFGMPKSSA